MLAAAGRAPGYIISATLHTCRAGTHRRAGTTDELHLQADAKKISTCVADTGRTAINNNCILVSLPAAGAPYCACCCRFDEITDFQKCFITGSRLLQIWRIRSFGQNSLGLQHFGPLAECWFKFYYLGLKNCNHPVISHNDRNSLFYTTWTQNNNVHFMKTTFEVRRLWF